MTHTLSSAPLPKQGLYHLAALGEHPHAASGLTQVIDRAAMDAICARFAEAAQAPHFPGLLVDFDHFSHQQDKPTEAAGWIVSLEPRADGLWASIRWTDVGHAAVQGGRYRFLSPVWLAHECEACGPGCVRPARLHRAALTNDPNLRGLVPLTNRGPSPALHASLLCDTANSPRPSVGTGKDAGERGAVKPRTKPMNPSLIQELALPSDASEADVLTAVRELRNRNVELSESCRQLLDTQAETDLNQYQACFQPEARTHWKEAILANRTATLALLRSVRAVAGKTAVDTPLHHRAGAPTPGPVTGTCPGNGESVVSRQRAAVAAYQNRSACSFEQAWQAVKAANPELFATSEISR